MAEWLKRVALNHLSVGSIPTSTANFLFEDIMLKFNGQKDYLRREQAETTRIIEGMVVHPYRKTVLTYATPIDEDFEVDTLEGVHTGKAGDYLAVGPHGEMYPIDVHVFLESYERADD